MSGRHWDGTVTHWSRKHSKHQQNLDEVFFPSVRVAPIVECVEFDYFAVLWQFGDVSILLCSYEHWISVMVENLHVNCHRKIAKTKVDDINVAICRRKLVFLQLLGKLLRSFITSHRLSTEITFARRYRMNYTFLSILIDTKCEQKEKSIYYDSLYSNEVDYCKKTHISLWPSPFPRHWLHHVSFLLLTYSVQWRYNLFQRPNQLCIASVSHSFADPIGFLFLSPGNRTP